mgnify:CR=1 FL=1
MVYQKHINANLLKVLHKTMQMVRFVTLCYANCYMAMHTVPPVPNPLKGLVMVRMRSGTSR